MQIQTSILVIGAGVSGLTTAICLAEAGLPVRVQASHPPRETSSCAAGAIWGPYLVNDDRVRHWSDSTHGLLTKLASDDETGVRVGLGIEACRTPTRPPAWVATSEGFQVCHPDELPDGFLSGWRYRAPLVDMPVYLDYLTRRLTAAGGRVEALSVPSLTHALTEAAIVVNCAGLGARRLVPDATVTPNRGQLVVVKNPGIDEFFVEHGDSPHPTYFIPHGDQLLLGGSSEPGRADLAPDPALAADIHRRCAAVDRRIADAPVLGHRVGLRPVRPRVRVEVTHLNGRHIIHNYGHGGAGVTLSWGCAADVRALAAGL